MPTKRTKKKTPKPTVKKAHRIADAIKASGGQKRGMNPYAVGMAAAKKAAAKRKRQRASR